jgi:hypothetical protein
MERIPAILIARTTLARKHESMPRYIDWSPVLAEKGGYRHFMLKEIHEQPRAILDTLAGTTIPESGEIFFETLPLADAALKGLRKVLLVACGTSWHAAQEVVGSSPSGRAIQNQHFRADLPPVWGPKPIAGYHAGGRVWLGALWPPLSPPICAADFRKERLE